MNSIHKKFLLKAHNIATKNLGNTFPNPSVGCIIVNNNKIISSAGTASQGRPHAEEIALKKAGSRAKGATMYVTLEPCNHISENGSCSEQIINCGIKSIYIAKKDNDPRTNGKSIKKFRLNNIKTFVGTTSQNTINLNKFFFESIKNKRPFIKAKMAISKDEKIAWKDYSSKWISNVKSRNFAHKLRFESQAILTTSKTVLKDNPRFTVRKNNKIIKYLPVIIIDRFLKTPIDCNLIKTVSKRRIIIFTLNQGKKFKKFQSLGCELFIMKKNKIRFKYNMSIVMKKILSLNINNILVEAGGIFLTELLSKKLLDELHIFTSQIQIGRQGKPMITSKKIKDLPLIEITKKNFGKDVYQYFKLKN